MSEIKLTLPDAKLESPGGLNGTAKDVQVEVARDLARAENLSEEEYEKIDSLMKQIDLHDNCVDMRYGESVQKQPRLFTGDTLKNVAGRDVSEIEKLISEMVASINKLNDALDAKPPRFMRAQKWREVLHEKCMSTSQDLERLRKELDGNRMGLLVDIKAMDVMYRHALDCYKKLTLHILAGRQKLEEVRNAELQGLKQVAEATCKVEDIFAYRSLQDKCESFEKRLQDLELTKTICLQAALQIQLAQKTNRELAQSIQSSANNAIAIWQQSIATARTLQLNADTLKAKNTELRAALDAAMFMQKNAQQRRVNMNESQ